MSKCTISSCSLISKGVSQLIKMGTMSSLRAHQITEQPFIATLFVITPYWLPWSTLCSASELCALREKGGRRRRRKKTPTITPAGWGKLKIEICRRSREGKIKHFQGVCNQPPIVTYWGRAGGLSEGLQACFVSGPISRNAIGTLIEVYDTVCDMPAAADAQNKCRTYNGLDTHMHSLYLQTHTHTVFVIRNTLLQIKGISVQWWTDGWSVEKAHLPDWN